jgi:TPR repeat protein
MRLINTSYNNPLLRHLREKVTQSQVFWREIMKSRISILVLFIIAFAACTNMETREQRFANTGKKTAGGNVLALYTLGLMYEQGYGVTQDKYQAALCYRKAAEKGQVQAQYRLGYLYYHGQGVPRDLQQATEWYEKAAEQGDPGAQAAFGNMHFIGESVNKLAKEKRRETPEELF